MHFLGLGFEDAVPDAKTVWLFREHLTRAGVIEAQMIEAVEGYLTHMGWREGQQAALVAHSDTEHAHVHVMLNAVHRETGCKLDDSLERRRSQEWALAYEREHARIHCEQRLAPVEEREDAPTRPAWLAKKEQLQAQEREDAARGSADEARHALDAPLTVGEEWARLKQEQREARESFFSVESREAHRQLGREVARQIREEFRAEWAGYFKLKATDPDHFLLRDIHDGLVATQEERQKEEWEKPPPRPASGAGRRISGLARQSEGRAHDAVRASGTGRRSESRYRLGGRQRFRTRYRSGCWR